MLLKVMVNRLKVMVNRFNFSKVFVDSSNPGYTGEQAQNVQMGFVLVRSPHFWMADIAPYPYLVG